MYAEAVRLLREEKYQEALEKWQEIKSIDSKYPDRQKVQGTARKSLAVLAKPTTKKSEFSLPKSLWIGLGGIVIVGVIVLALNLYGNNGEQPSSPAISAPTPTSGGGAVIPTTTETPVKASATSQPVATQESSGYTDPTMYDDFDKTAYDGSYNKSFWNLDTNSKNFMIGQSDGNLSIKVYDLAGIGLHSTRSLSISEPIFFEARLYLDPRTTNKGCHLYFELSTSQGYSNCGILRTGDYAQQVQCWSEYYGKHVDANWNLTGILPDWHILRFEVEPETMTISYVIDGEALDSINLKETFPSNFRLLKELKFNVGIGMNNYGPAEEPIGYVDYVRIGELAP
jgi:hypothetical protein